MSGGLGVEAQLNAILPSCVALILPFAGSISPRRDDSSDAG